MAEKPVGPDAHGHILPTSQPTPGEHRRTEFHTGYRHQPVLSACGCRSSAHTLISPSKAMGGGGGGAAIKRKGNSKLVVELSALRRSGASSHAHQPYVGAGAARFTDEETEATHRPGSFLPQIGGETGCRRWELSSHPNGDALCQGLFQALPVG